MLTILAIVGAYIGGGLSWAGVSKWLASKKAVAEKDIASAVTKL